MPWLAKSWDINTDATQFTFHLRSGVTKLGALVVLAQGYPSSVKSTTAVDPLTESSASVKRAPQRKCSDGVVGSGPFVLKSYVQNQSITLAKRTGYDWGSSL